MAETSEGGRWTVDAKKNKESKEGTEKHFSLPSPLYFCPHPLSPPVLFLQPPYPSPQRTIVYIPPALLSATCQSATAPPRPASRLAKSPPANLPQHTSVNVVARPDRDDMTVTPAPPPVRNTDRRFPRLRAAAEVPLVRFSPLRACRLHHQLAHPTHPLTAEQASKTPLLLDLSAHQSSSRTHRL